MASKERLDRTSVNSERYEALARKAKELMEGWQRERGERLTEQLAVNIEIKKRWLEYHRIEARQRRMVNGGATFFWFLRNSRRISNV